MMHEEGLYSASSLKYAPGHPTESVLTCPHDQALFIIIIFFFVSQTKREEGPPDRRLTQCKMENKAKICRIYITQCNYNIVIICFTRQPV